MLRDFRIHSSVPPKCSVRCSNWWVPSPGPCKSVRGMPRRMVWRAHQSRCGRAWNWKDGRRWSSGDGLDRPTHHRTLVAVLVDGDAGGAPDAAPDVGTEEAVGEVAHEDDVVGPVPRRDGLPHDGVQPRRVVVALDGVVARRRLLRREREVPPVGGALEQDVRAPMARDALDPPRGVQRRAGARAQGDAAPVLVGVELPAGHGVTRPRGRAAARGHRRGGTPLLALSMRDTGGRCGGSGRHATVRAGHFKETGLSWVRQSRSVACMLVVRVRGDQSTL